MQNNRFLSRIARIRSKVRSQHEKHPNIQIVSNIVRYRHPSLSRFTWYQYKYQSTSSWYGNIDYEKVDLGTTDLEKTGVPGHGSVTTCPNSLHMFSTTDLKEYTARKKLLMQYLQNDIWHQVDRIVHLIENEQPLDNLRERVERQYRYNQRASKKFVASKNLKRLQKRKQRREVQEEVGRESNFVMGSQDDDVIVPTKFLGDSAFDVLFNNVGRDENCSKVVINGSSKDTSNIVMPSSNNVDVVENNMESSDNFMTREKNRLLSLLDKREDGHDRSKSMGDDNSDFTMRPRVTDANSTLLDLLDDDYYYDDKDVATGKKQTSLLDLLDDNVWNNDDYEQDFYAKQQSVSRNKESRGLLSMLDDRKDFETNTQGNQMVTDDEKSKQNHFLEMSDVGSLQAHKKTQTKSLLDLLNDDHYTGGESNRDNPQIAKTSTAYSQIDKESLLDLLESENSMQSDMSKEQSANGPKQIKSLFTLLDTIESDNSNAYYLGDKAKSATSEVIFKGRENISNKHEPSLLDLLDDASLHHETSQITNSQHIGSSSNKKSLLDILQEHDTKVLGREPSSSLDSSVTKTSYKDYFHMQEDAESTFNGFGNELEDGGRLNSSHNDMTETSKSNLNPTQDNAMGNHELERSEKLQNSLLNFLEDNFEDTMEKSSDAVETLQGSDFLTNEGGPVDETNEIIIEEVEESFSKRDAMSKVQSLLSVMRRNDWDAFFCIPQKSQPYTQNNSKRVNQDYMQRPKEAVHDAKQPNGEKDDMYSGEYDVMMSHLTDELLTGSSVNKWILGADEFNILLLHVVTSNRPDKIEKLLDIFLHMKELESCGHYHCGPNTDTFAILLSFLDRFPGTSSIAYDLAKEMIDNMTMHNDLTSIDECYRQKQQKFIINEQCLNAAMRVCTKHLDIDRAERLMNFALSEFGEGVRVNPNLFGMMLLLYKCENLQDKALDLIKTCIEENKAEHKSLNRFLLNASDWPKYKRDGTKIVLGSYLNSFAKILDSMERQEYFVSIVVWKKLLGFLAHVAQTESESNWSTVHKCCRTLISNKDFSKYLNERLILLGLEASEKMKDPHLAADLICCSNTFSSSEHVMDSFERPKGAMQIASMGISPKTYIKAIKLCIDNGIPMEAERILKHCYQSNLPPKVLSDMYAAVLAGYVRIGDTENIETLFSNVKSSCIRPSEAMYAAYLNHLGANKKHEKVMSVLNSMLNGSNDDDVTPGISCFSSSILSAINSRNYNDVIQLEETMRERGLDHNASTLHGVLIANARLGRKEEVLNALGSALQSKSPMDSSTFKLCLKYILPEIMDNCGNDIEAIRAYLRSQVQSNPAISNEAMELSKSLKNCLREDGRKPSKMNNQAIIENARNLAWRCAVRDALCLSNALCKSL